MEFACDDNSESLAKMLWVENLKSREKGSAPTGQVHENDPAKVVILSSPGLPKLMGSLHPAGSLYEKPVNLKAASEQHENFRTILKSYGITVFDVKDILGLDVDENVGARMRLENLASHCLRYKLSPSASADLHADYEQFVSKRYKEQVLRAMSTDQLIDIVQTMPTVTIEPSSRDTGWTATYAFLPLTNLVYARDQQITTSKGIVMCRPQAPQREREVDILQFCLQKLKLNVVGRIPAPGFLEGGDFFPAGRHLCLVGVGLRSNFEAVQYLMNEDLLGTTSVAVVRDTEQTQDRMHLDTVFNIVSEDCVLMYENMMGPSSQTARYVDEWSRPSGREPYRLVREHVEFSQYIQEKGYHILAIPEKDQLNYGCNGLNVGNGCVISVHEETARRLARFPLFQGTVRYMEFDAITTMYGAAHCASQVVLRESVV
eukprot:NODE_1782_length_1409_cov_43.466912_g1611_i0.p1 GENE.NODE_1782_length_1409_cov_43.466912_g1611_i0~~NODE_1782_length_1409_cov_43.466912_g1611_i0.p1  ORF type:complete len:431 (-),score=46.30 NODE_1782_length_1409_cov_43.466912_g1611_i0:63-1355(-)